MIDLLSPPGESNSNSFVASCAAWKQQICTQTRINTRLQIADASEAHGLRGPMQRITPD